MPHETRNQPTASPKRLRDILPRAIDTIQETQMAMHKQQMLAVSQRQQQMLAVSQRQQQMLAKAMPRSARMQQWSLLRAARRWAKVKIEHCYPSSGYERRETLLGYDFSDASAADLDALWELLRPPSQAALIDVLSELAMLKRMEPSQASAAYRFATYAEHLQDRPLLATQQGIDDIIRDDSNPWFPSLADILKASERYASPLRILERALRQHDKNGLANHSKPDNHTA